MSLFQFHLHEGAHASNAGRHFALLPLNHFLEDVLLLWSSLISNATIVITIIVHSSDIRTPSLRDSKIAIIYI